MTPLVVTQREQYDSLGRIRAAHAATPTGQDSPDPVVEAVRSKLLQRSERGLTKYGVTVADSPLSREEWLRHAQEEAMDLAIYLERILSKHVTESDAASFSQKESLTLSLCKETLERVKGCPSTFQEKEPPSVSAGNGQNTLTGEFTDLLRPEMDARYCTLPPKTTTPIQEGESEEYAD
jgi:hypothetical protein